MSGLGAIGDAARKEAWDEAERQALKEDKSKQEDDEEVEMGRPRPIRTKR